MPRNIDIALLRAFLGVVETGSVTRAARLLNLTQAAVSQQLRRLEELFGTALFDRAGRQMRLTLSGERLVPHAEKLMSLNDEVFGLMSAAQHEGEVRLGVPHDIIMPNIPPVLRRFDHAYPKVRLTLVSSTTKLLLDDLANGVIDLMLSTLPATPEAAELLLADQLVWVGGRGGDAHTRTPLPLSLGEETCMFRAVSTKLLAEADRDWRPVCTVGTWEPVHATLVADLAVMPMLRSSVPADLAIIGPEAGLPALPAYNINMHFPATGRSVLAEELAQMIRQEFKSRYGSQRAAEMKARVAA